MKCINYAIVVLICILTLGNIAQAQTEAVSKPELWENPKLSPTQRWEAKLEGTFNRTVNNPNYPKEYTDQLKSSKIEKYYYQINSFIVYGFLGFWSANNRPVNDLNELYSKVYFDITDELNYQVTPMFNPLTNQPLKIVPFTNPSPGDISYLHSRASNGVDSITVIVWNDKFFNNEIEYAKLIEANGGIEKFIYRNELYGHDYIREINKFIRKSIKTEFHYCHLPGQPYKYNVKNRWTFYENWGDLLEGYEGLSKPEIPVDFSDPIFKPLDKSLAECKDYSKYSNAKLTPEQRWQFIADFIHSNQPESYQKTCKEVSKENYLVHLDYAIQFGLKQYFQQFNKLPISIDQLFNTKLNIAGSEVKIGYPQNIYYLRPMQQTSLDVPAPGDISYFVDNVNNPKKAIAIVWSQAPDNEEMYWLQLFDKTYGLVNFSIDPLTKEFRLFRGTYLVNFSNSIDRIYMISLEKDGVLKIND